MLNALRYKDKSIVILGYRINPIIAIICDYELLVKINVGSSVKAKIKKMMSFMAVMSLGEIGIS